MWIAEALGLGVGLAMDACAVSMSNGLSEPKMKTRKAVLIATFFGVFQILMPVLGYLAVTVLNNVLGEKFTTIFNYLVPWVALGLLAFLGIKMIIEAIKDGKNGETTEQSEVEIDEGKKLRKGLTLSTLFVQAIATAIDALSVGIIFGEKEPFIAYITFGIIGIVTWLISFGAVFIGKKFGTIFSNKAAFAGGIILIAIGFEIFFTNWGDVIGGLQALFNLLAF